RRIRGVGDAARNESHEIAFRRRALGEASTGCDRTLDSVDAERSPVVAAQVPGSQIPAAPGVDPPRGLYLPAAERAIPVVVMEAQLFRIAARTGDRRERFGIDFRLRIRHRHDEGMQRLDAPAQPRWQNLLKLRQSANGRFFDPGNGATG